MADNVELDPATGGAVVATDDIGGKHFQRFKLIHGNDGVNDGDVSKSNPLPVTSVPLDGVVSSLATAVSLAAGASTDLDSPAITSGKTGKLVSLVVCSSVAIRAELKTVLNGIATSRAVLFGLAGMNVVFPVPSKEVYSAPHSATAGFDGFRVTVMNLDINQAADVYANYIYDEVT